MSQRLFINTLEQTWPQVTMNFHRAPIMRSVNSSGIYLPTK
jgi:hypothetical protein